MRRAITALVAAAGLARAESLEDIDHQAWAMRDAFDGLLAVIEKYMRSQLPGAAKATIKTSLPN